MPGSDQGSAREEAERLVAAVIAAASAASRQGSGSGPLGSLGSLGSLGEAVFSAAGQVGSAVRGPWATGSPECCVCPICRVIAALRDPSADFPERLSTGAGDFATGVASLLRALSAAAAATRPRGPAGGRTPAGRDDGRPPPAKGNDGRAPAGSDDTTWRLATRAGTEPGRSAPTEADPWASATATDAAGDEPDVAEEQGTGR
ncbi:MAG TPA: hypothetical protein VGJ63_10880 [Micromonosporaceae bacterium]